MRTKPRLELPHNPDQNTWECFSMIKVAPVLLDDFLLVILTITFIDGPLQRD